MNMNPTIGVVLTSTNSFSRGFLVYLASVESWGKFADKVLVVDGGTTDESYDILKTWTDNSNWEVYSTPETYWPMNGHWHAGQWTVNYTIGLYKIDTDWVIHANSDYVLRVETADNLRRFLAENSNEYMVTFNRTKLDNFGKEKLTGLKGFILNMKKIREDGLHVGMGINYGSGGYSDAPIFLDYKTYFKDPVNNFIKMFNMGRLVPSGKHIDLTCTVYGHYFFTKEQFLSKAREMNLCYQVRYAKRSVRSNRILSIEYGLNSKNRILPKDIELSKPHPIEIKKIIDKYYNPEMLGHSAGVAVGQTSYTMKYVRFIQVLKMFKMYMIGFPCVMDKQIWYRFDDDVNEILDLKALYSEQDRLQNL
jgi:hypothetical protein